ncbi:hypothetical protein GN958_ATG01125 [Phytophthora infestans]|uniref:Uncharacterized protein n=1 Tax=Phytophthora infestans TaxID=4787 RepID=A0A8S9VET2_PHYIN|nr:hypothetical protein GN958_ATG01125 [Phytophthora infestans]
MEENLQVMTEHSLNLLDARDKSAITLAEEKADAIRSKITSVKRRLRNNPRCDARGASQHFSSC